MQTTYSTGWKNYELIDAGGGKKLEKWGEITTIRPDRNAYFPPVLPEREWRDKVDFEFIETSVNTGEWIKRNPVAPTEWTIKYGKVIANLKLTKFKHIGIFPEQQINWDFIQNKVKEGDNFLNLFGYTGVASLIAKANNANVVHCDSVKQVISWAKENMESSYMEDVKWVLDDALKFAKREVKRGNKYEGIIMDPPAFGIAKKERWRLEDKFTELLQTAKKLMTENGFVIVNTYSPKLDFGAIKRAANSVFTNNKVEITRLSMKTTTGKRLDFGELTKITTL